MDNSFDFLYSDPSNDQPEKASVGTIKCGDYTPEEYEEAMQWLLSGDEK